MNNIYEFDVNNDNPSFEFANEYEDNSFVSEFNADADNNFDFAKSIEDENILDNYEDNINFPFEANIFDDNKEDTIELNYNGVNNSENIENENSKTNNENIENENSETNNELNDSNIDFNESIFNDIKNDTFSYKEDYSVPITDNNIESAVNNDYIPFDTSVFDNIQDNGENINSEFVNNEFNENEELNIPITTIDSNEVETTNSVDDVTFTLPVENKEKVSKNEETTKEDIYNEIDNSIKALDAETDFKIEDNSDLSTDINSLFVKVNSNVKEAGDIFTRNVEMKKILDNRFEELKKLQSDIEVSRKTNLEEITNYKEEVINKLADKKAEIEEKLELLKTLQADFEKEKNEFEIYKKDEIVKLEKMRKEEEESFEQRREEISRIEDKLRKQKDYLEEEKRQLSLDQIKYETDKNELANNMIKFNEIVSKFTSGIDGIN